ncbi:MAG TPA: pre-peptidase C-terminal domain-containing protein [Crinalium sp.]|jgi:ELWxxDGT repeat protein
MATGPGNTRQTARLVALGPTVKNLKGLLTAKDGNDFWKFTLGTRSSFNANLTKLGKTANADLQLLNATGRVIAASKQPKNKPEKISNFTLDAGTFFVRVLRRAGTTRYTLGLQATPSAVPVPVPVPSPTPDPNTPIPGPSPNPTPTPTGLEDNTFDIATAFTLSSPVNGYSVGSANNEVGDTDPEDYYQFTLPNSGQLKLQLAGLQADANIELFDANRTSLGAGDFNDIITKTISDGEVGSTFYVRVLQAGPGNNTNYTLNLSLLPTDTVGNDAAGAKTLNPSPTKLTQNEFAGGNDDADVYKFNLASQSFLSLDVANLGGNVDIELFSNVNGQFGNPRLLGSTRTGSAAEQLGGTLSPGNYFIRVYAADPNGASPYNLSLTAASTTGIPTLTRDIIYGQSGANVKNLTNVNGTLFFSADNDEGEGQTLWKSTDASPTTGGTLDKTIKVSTDSFSTLSSFVNVGGTLYFSGTKSSGEKGVWKSDGTTISLVADVLNPTNLTAAGNVLYFVAPKVGGVNTDLRIWRSDGTTAAEVANAGLFPSDLVATDNGSLFYIATDPATSNNKGTELWRITSGSSQPELLDINTDPSQGGFGQSNLKKLTAVGNSLFFTGTSTGRIDQEVMRLQFAGATYNPSTDLTVFDIDQSITDSSIPSSLDADWNFAVVGGDVYFGAIPTGKSQDELYKITANATTATKVQTDPQKVIVQNPRDLTSFNGKLLFKGTAPGGNKKELWVTDGTDAGTIQLTTRPDGALAIGDLMVAGTKFFFASDGLNGGKLTGQELWTSDGTVNGTQLVYDIFPGELTSTDPNDPNSSTTVANSAGVAEFTNVNGRLFFTANDGVNGQELWSVF